MLQAAPVVRPYGQILLPGPLLVQVQISYGLRHHGRFWDVAEGMPSLCLRAPTSASMCASLLAAAYFNGWVGP